MVPDGLVTICVPDGCRTGLSPENRCVCWLVGGAGGAYCWTGGTGVEGGVPARRFDGSGVDVL